ncbi:uncharacterized protein si:dkey-92i15.4 [Engraulis encrasicolus]|uniref:uncharacterized protein si:dkey-92i15.4 n=1 Tax=Engraulis encrasicolus TaxID=184585 RepID=UPI002FCED667
MSVAARSAVVDSKVLPQGMRSAVSAAESPAVGAASSSTDRPMCGSAAARFTVRSANDLTYQDVRRTGMRNRPTSIHHEKEKDKDNRVEAERARPRQRNDVGETAKATSGSASHQPSAPSSTDVAARERGRPQSRVKFTHDTKMAHDPVGTGSGTAGEVKIVGGGGGGSGANLDEPGKANDQLGRGRTEWRKKDMQSRSKSLDWRGQDRSRPGTHDLSGSTASARRGESLERKDARNSSLDRRALYKDSGRANSVSSRIQAFNALRENEKPLPSLGEEVKGTSSLRLNRVTPTVDRTGGDRSLPLRLRSQDNHRSPVEGIYPWRQASQEDSSPTGAKPKAGSLLRDLGASGSKPREVTGNQSISDRIEKLNASYDAKAKRHSAPVGDWLDGLPPDLNVSSYQRRPSSHADIVLSPHSVQKGGTFPRRFSHSGSNLSTDTSNPSQSVLSRRETSPSLFTSATPLSSRYRERSVERKTFDPPDVGLYTKSLDRSRSRLSATAQLKHLRETETPSKDFRKESIPTGEKSRGVVMERSIKEAEPEGTIDKDVTDGKAKESVMGRRDGLRLKTDQLSRTKDSQETATAMANKPLVESEVSRAPLKEHTSDKCLTNPSKGQTSPTRVLKSVTEDEDVFDSAVHPGKGQIRRKDAIKSKFSTPSLDSVRNTIHKFEALSQKTQGASQYLTPRRALSVPAHPSDRGGLKKSESDLAVGGKMQKGNSGIPQQDKGWATTRSISVDEVGLRQLNSDRFEIETKTLKTSSNVPRPETLEKDLNGRNLDELDFSKSAHNPSPYHKNNHNNNSNGGFTLDFNNPETHRRSNVVNDSEDADKTPTNSPDSLHLFLGLNGNLATSPKTEALSDSILQPQSPDSEPPTPTNSFQPTKASVFVRGPDSLANCPPLDRLTLLDKPGDLGPFSVAMARWSSDEEDDEDDDDHSDSDESSLTITSNMSQSDRRSFSVSLAELCNFGGVDYSPSDSEEEADDWPCGRSASLSSDISALSCVTLLGAEELDNLLQDVRNLGDDTLQNYEDVQVVVLHKEMGTGLGFTVAGGQDQNKPVTVHKVFPHGVAGQQGSIREGDLVLSINGTTLQGCAHWEALRTVRKARGRDMAVVVLQRGVVATSGQKRGDTGKPPLNTNKEESGRQLRVTLRKQSSDLGFSLEGGLGSNLGDRPLTVKKIFQGGPVSDVCPGDELLEIDGQTMEGLRRLEAWQLIKKIPHGQVELLLWRPHTPH